MGVDVGHGSRDIAYLDLERSGLDDEQIRRTGSGVGVGHLAVVVVRSLVRRSPLLADWRPRPATVAWNCVAHVGQHRAGLTTHEDERSEQNEDDPAEDRADRPETRP